MCKIQCQSGTGKWSIFVPVTCLITECPFRFHYKSGKLASYSLQRSNRLIHLNLMLGLPNLASHYSFVSKKLNLKSSKVRLNLCKKRSQRLELMNAFVQSPTNLLCQERWFCLQQMTACKDLNFHRLYTTVNEAEIVCSGSSSVTQHSFKNKFTLSIMLLIVLL